MVSVLGMEDWINLGSSHVAEGTQKFVGGHSIFAEAFGQCSVLVELQQEVLYVVDLVVAPRLY